MRKLPAIACDIDGVLLRGPNAIKSAIAAIHHIRQPLSTPRIQIPFVCLSNSGGNLEQTKADQLNNLLSLQDPQTKLKKENIILNFTPLRQTIHNYHDHSVLIVGRGKINEIMEDCGISLYLHTKEYNLLKEKPGNIYPHLLERFKTDEISSHSLDKFLNIKAIFILNDPIEWEESIYLICKLVHKNPKIPIFSSHNDSLYSDEFPLPRFGLGGFNEVLLDLSAKISHKRFSLNYSGKPLSRAFEFSKEILRKMANSFEISQFYMIGDNPSVDILGGKNSGFKTILVRTGVFKEEGNDRENPADFVVEDFAEAIKTIAKIEGVLEAQKGNF